MRRVTLKKVAADLHRWFLTPAVIINAVHSRDSTAARGVALSASTQPCRRTVMIISATLNWCLMKQTSARGGHIPRSLSTTWQWERRYPETSCAKYQDKLRSVSLYALARQKKEEKGGKAIAYCETTRPTIISMLDAVSSPARKTMPLTLAIVGYFDVLSRFAKFLEEIGMRRKRGKISERRKSGENYFVCRRESAQSYFCRRSGWSSAENDTIKSTRFFSAASDSGHIGGRDARELNRYSFTLHSSTTYLFRYSETVFVRCERRTVFAVRNNVKRIHTRCSNRYRWNYCLQLCTLISSEYDMNLLLKVLSTSFPVIIYTLKYNIYYVKATKVSHVFTLIFSSFYPR